MTINYQKVQLWRHDNTGTQIQFSEQKSKMSILICNCAISINNQKMIVIGIIAILAILFLCYIYGVFHPTTIYNYDLLNPHLLYYSFKGNHQEIGKQYGDITNRAKDHFKLTDCFGIFHGGPNDPQWKCVIGLLVSVGQKGKVQDFLQNNQHFKQAKLRTTRCVATSMPYINFLSFFLLHRKAIQFAEKLITNNIKRFNGSFELYHFNFSSKSIELINPLDNHEQFELYEQE